ncbi:MAG: RNA methyltransferase [Muribaculaceae bacterium]|nr:RNA methyltransferase [Muribaculaceae bacterium]
MSEIIEITSADHPGTEPYARLTEAQLRSSAPDTTPLFIAESPKVIRTALDAGMTPVSLMCERRHIDGDAADIIARMPSGVPVYTAERSVLAQLTGYTLTRGVLCAMKRPAPRSVADVATGASRVAVIDGVSDTTNIGAIFRSAAALGIDAVVLTSTSCDPLNRRSVRVSMGSVFLVPWAVSSCPARELQQLGFKTVALALTDDSVSIDDPRLMAEPRLALMLGTEGDGLARDVIAGADYVARIPMHHGVDSLNVAAASAVAFWQLRAHR